MGRKRKNPLPEKDPTPSPSASSSEVDESPKKRSKKTKAKSATLRSPSKKVSKAQKKPKTRAARQEIVLEMKDLRMQLDEEMERVNAQIQRFGDALEIALRELDQVRGVCEVERVVEVV